MTTYEATFDRRLVLERSSAPSTTHEAPSTTLPRALARAAVTLVVLVAMSALFGLQIAATLR